MAKKKTDKEDETPGIGHNSGQSFGKLKALIGKIERLEGEKKAVAEDISEVYQDAKANGFDPKVIRIVVRRRQMEREKLQEQDEQVSLYESAAGG